MKKSMTKRALLSVLGAAFISLAASAGLYAQNVTNNGTGVINNTGTIRMKSSGGLFNGDAAYGTQAKPVPGTVVWVCTSDMTIPAGTYYTNLGTEGAGKKTYLGNVYISGTYTPTGGNRDYTTNNVNITFNGTGPQAIPGENTTNGTGYRDLTLAGAGAKSIATGQTATVANDFKHDGGALANAGTLTLGSGPAASTADIVNTGTFNGGSGAFSNTTTFTNNASGAGGGVSVGTGAWTLANLTNTAGGLTIPNNGTVNLGGTFTYTAGVMAFDCNSNFNYTGAAQNITANVAPDFPSYGNLTLGGTGAKTASGNVSVCNNLAVSQETDMATYTMNMLNTNNTGVNKITYTGAVEIAGNVQYNNIQAGTAYTYNNANTNVTFDTPPTTFALDVRQQTAPSKYSTFDATKDIRRRVIPTFTGTGNISQLNISWEAADQDASFVAADLGKIRYAEGFNSAQPAKKLVRSGAAYDRTTANVLKYGGGTNQGISLAAAHDASPALASRQLLSSSEIVLTTRPMVVYSVTNGRWSNPATWDIGAMPSANDDVEVRNVVWTGIDQAVFGGAAFAGNETNGSLADDAGASANSITIANVANSALVIGNSDADQPRRSGTDEVVFRTRESGGPANGMGIFNLNTNNNSGDGESTSATGLNGIWIRSVSGTFVPVLGGLQLTNAGSMTNNSILEVGICK
jgi:hypothetical protein